METGSIRKTRGRSIWLWVLPLVCLWLLSGAAALANDQKVTDEAGILTADEIEKLQDQYAAIVKEYGCDLAVVTVDSCGGTDIQDFTDAYYEQHGYGVGSDLDGILLLVSMGDRQFHMTTMGEGIRIFTDYGMQKIDDAISGDLSDGEYYEAFRTFGRMGEAFMKEAKEGKSYDVGHPYREPMALWLRIVIVLGSGVVVCALVLGILFSQLKSVGHEKRAQVYAREGSFQVTRAYDLFLYRTVTRHRIVRDQSRGGPGGSMTHTTPGGHSAGGHTGSF